MGILLLDPGFSSPKDIPGLQAWYDASAANSVLSDGAAHFAAANSQSLSIASNASITPGDTEYTWAGWVYADTISGTPPRFLSKDAGTTEYLMGFTAPGGNVFYAVGTSGGQVQVNSTATVTTATWYFIVAQRTKSPNQITIQVNNGTAATASLGASTHNSGTSSLLFGNDGGASRFWDGRMDSFGYWSRALTPEELTILYNNGTGQVFAGLSGSLLTNLVSWWDLNEETGTRYDAFGTNHLTASTTVLISNSPATLNGGFETAGAGGADVFANWTESVTPASSLTDETVIVHSGTNACLFACDASNNPASVAQTVLTVGNRYSFTLWSRSTATPGGVSVGGVSAIYNTFNITTSYVQYSGSFVAVDTTFKIIRATGFPSQNVYIDDVVLTDLGPVGIAGVAAGVATDGNFCAQFVTNSSQSLAVANSAATQGGNFDLSVAGWFYFDSNTTRMDLISKWAAGNNDYLLYFQGAGQPFQWIIEKNDGSGSVSVNGANFGVPPVGQWMFVVGIHDFANNLLKLSVNNGTPNTQATTTGMRAGTGEFDIGRTTPSTGFFNGRADSIGVWAGHALTPTEITALYNNGKGLKYAGLAAAGITAPTAYYDLDKKAGITTAAVGSNLTNNNAVTFAQGVDYYEGVVSKLLDQSGKGNHATQTTQSKRPAYLTNFQNGKPGILFDGVSNILRADAVASLFTGTNKPFSIYAVIQRVSGTSGGFVSFDDSTANPLLELDINATTWRIVVRDSSGTSKSIAAGTTDTATHILSTTFDGTNAKLYLDSAQQGSTTDLTVGAVTFSTLGIGGRPSAGVDSTFASAYIMSVLIYNAGLTPGQDTQVKAFLKAKWQTP